MQAATFTLEGDDGKSFDMDLTPIEVKPDMTTVFTSASATVPVSRQHPTDALWFTLMPDGKTVYANFRRYDSLEHDAKAPVRPRGCEQGERGWCSTCGRTGRGLLQGAAQPRGADQEASRDQREGALLRARRTEDVLRRDGERRRLPQGHPGDSRR
jgi:hypothetical protein